MSNLPTPTRRSILASSLALGASAVLPLSPWANAKAAPSSSHKLRAASGQAQIAPATYGKTPIWCYNDTLPGSEIRIRQGERLRVSVTNALNEDTTVHWHGVRLPNSMDGVPDLIQVPIAADQTFTYEFDAIDAGTFWYHPHQRSFEQVGRGLYGPLIVEEAEPIQVDRDVTWMLDDWRLTETAEISADFGNRHDMSHNGRIGNTVTINGQVPEVFSVRKGERVRLRLINVANARIFGLDFQKHRPVIIALDGQPVTPHEPENGIVVLGPAMRVDIVLDATGVTDSRASVVDRFYEGLEYRLVDIAYDKTAKRESVPDWPLALPANPLPEPDLENAERHDVVFNGGMMGGMVMRDMGGSMGESVSGGMMGGMGAMMGGMHSGKIWFVNGVAATGHIMDPMLILTKDRSHVIAMTNATAWHHPIHLHGHSFRVLSRNGTPTKHREWQDTVLMAPRERVEIAFVADNPGDWMFHCHILEHQAAGMMGVIRVPGEGKPT